MDRNARLIRDLASFIPLRRRTLDVYIAILMTTLDLEIPPQVYPTMQRMLDLISDMILLENVRCAQLVIPFICAQLTL